MKALAKAFELSSCAAARVGPKMRRPRPRKMSTAPAASAASGPTTVSAIFSARANSARRSSPVMARFFSCGSAAVPALPGATNTVCTRGDWASFQASACSRPPLPMTSTFIRASPATASARSCGHLGVVEDGLRVVEVLDHVEELLHSLGLVADERHSVLGPHRHLGVVGLEARTLERAANGFELVRRREDLDRAVVVADHIVGAGLERHFHDPVFVRAGREHDLAAVLELERDRAFGAEVAAVLAERVAHLGDGAHPVVGHAVDDDRGAADAVALVADLLVVHALEVAGRLVDVLLDRVGRHVRTLGLFDRQAQARIHRQVAAAVARGDDDLVDQARPHLAAFLVLAALPVLDVGPLRMTSHDVSKAAVRWLPRCAELMILGARRSRAATRRELPAEPTLN